MDVQNTFLAVALGLAFSIVSGITASLFLVPPKEMIRGKRFFCRDKVDLFKRYLKFEKSYKKGILSGQEWEEKRKEFFKEYREITK